MGSDCCQITDRGAHLATHSFPDHMVRSFVKTQEMLLKFEISAALRRVHVPALRCASRETGTTYSSTISQQSEDWHEQATGFPAAQKIKGAHLMSLKRDPRALPHPCAPACRRRGAASHTPPRLVSDTPRQARLYTAFVAQTRRAGEEYEQAAPANHSRAFAACGPTPSPLPPSPPPSPPPHTPLSPISYSPFSRQSLPPRPASREGCFPRRARRHYQQHGEVLDLPEAGLAHLHDHHEEREEVILPLSTPPHRPHAHTHTHAHARTHTHAHTRTHTLKTPILLYEPAPELPPIA